MCLTSHPGRYDAESQTLVTGTLCNNGKAAGSATQQDAENGFLVAHTLRGEGHDASEDGTGRGVPLVAGSLTNRVDRGGVNSEGSDGHLIPMSFPWQIGGGMQMPHDVDLCGTLVKNQTQAVAFAQNQRDELREMAVAGALAAQPGMKQQTYLMQPVAFDAYNQAASDVAHTPRRGTGASGDAIPQTVSSSAVRRLTPEECEALQGFPRSWTAITHRSKPAADGPRYKALGNSMAVPVLTWIGKRIAMQEALA
jgi:DNA (cytosine-5)-methyltransferase 1